LLTTKKETMKISYYIFLLGFVLSWAACSDFLEVELDDEIIASEAITSKETLEAASIGLYHNLQGGSLYGGDAVVFGELMGGNAIATGFQPFYEELADARVPAGNNYVENTWVDLYNIINSANNILMSVDGIEGISEDTRNQIAGTAHFFRAFALFDLLRQYGEFFDITSRFGIPVFTEVLTSNSALNVSRSNVANSYAQIISDLITAEGLLLSDTDLGLVDRGSAQALLARVFLYQKDYSSAEAYATLVIENDKYRLDEDFAANFGTTGSNVETIFELAFNDQDGNDLPRLLVLAGSNEVSVADALADIYLEDDTRSAFLVRRFGVYRCTKYGELATDISTNTPILRLAEQYLIRSEAKLFLEGPSAALADLNTVRTRVMADNPIDLSEVPSEETFIDKLLEERRLELAFEGHYWFDLVRYGKATEARGIEAYRRILPIPLREVQVSDGLIEQNPGY
jgi:hypothetical protein